MGVTGQDGSLLAKQLLDRGFEVFGGFRRGSSNFWRLEELEITNKIELLEFQLMEIRGLFSVISEFKFDHIYHLAGDGYVVDSFDHPSLYLQTHTLSLLDLLELVRTGSPLSRVYYASTSEIFGPSSKTTSLHVDETASPNPVSPYAVAKLTAQNLSRLYRERWSLYVSCGILFNHESVFRSKQFLTRKITSSIAEMGSEGRRRPIVLGDMQAQKDWSAAQDIVAGMILMLEADQPDDYVFGSGQKHSVRDVLELACSAAGLDVGFEGSGVNQVCFEKSSGELIAVSSDEYFRSYPQIPFTADTTKALNNLGWRPEVGFPELIADMTKRDIERVVNTKSFL